jgi:hypothetical protein
LAVRAEDRFQRLEPGCQWMAVIVEGAFEQSDQGTVRHQRVRAMVAVGARSPLHWIDAKPQDIQGATLFVLLQPVPLSSRLPSLWLTPVCCGLLIAVLLITLVGQAT